MPASAKEEKKIFDVAKPGKSAPTETARPIIVGHGPMARDPMMAAKPSDDDADTNTPQGKPADLLVTRSKTIKPITMGADAEAPKPEAESTKPAEATTKEPDQSAPEQKASTQPTEPEKPADPAPAAAPAASSEPAPKPSTPEAIEEEDDSPEARMAKQQAQDEQERVKQEAIAKMIAEKKYHLKIHESDGKHTGSMLATVVVLVLLLAAGAYLAVDAGVVEPPVNLPIDIIKN